jgi:FkbM family methyltransferase
VAACVVVSATITTGLTDLSYAHVRVRCPLARRAFALTWLQWRGILIEGQPRSFKDLAYSRPNVVTVNAAACEAPKFVHFSSKVGPGSHIINFSGRPPLRGTVTVPCLPLKSVLESIRVNHIDFFSLDVENYELDALKGIDWSRLAVSTMTVEELQTNKQKAIEVRNLLAKAGLRYLFKHCWKPIACDAYFANPKYVRDVVGIREAARSRDRLPVGSQDILPVTHRCQGTFAPH